MVFFVTSLGARGKAAEVDFSRDIRPILSNHCFACHGPDAQERQADLRLDVAEGLSSVVDTDDVDQSELLARIDASDPDVVMPPPEFHKPISDGQREKLRQWIAGGAEFQSHWAFAPPIAGQSTQPAESPLAEKSPARVVTPVQTDFQIAGHIDAFINQAAIDAGLSTNERADGRTLLRRVCLDLTGLPPTRAQMESFDQDASPQAYENLVDELLRSPDFGQHVGRYWLDLVRYADTHGLHLDNYREMWPYRDWVIDAFNANLPFDEFITRQLAGDLLPDATDRDRIASGFNRLNVTTSEGGSIYDEVFARNCIDRTDAFGTIFLGLTTGCAVCHDHKFDPISQKDYYSLLAFFNSLDGRALDGNAKDHPPVIPVPSDEQVKSMAELDQTLVDIQQQMKGPIESVDTAQRAWEESLTDGSTGRHERLHPSEVISDAKAQWITLDDGSVKLVGDAADKETLQIVSSFPSGVQWQTLALEAMVDDPTERVGASANGNAVLSEITVEVTDTSTPGQWSVVPIAHAVADVEQGNGDFAVSYAIDGKLAGNQGWAVAGHEQTGGRSAWFVIPSLTAEAADARIRVTLKFQSVYAKHQFKHVRLSLSDSMPSVPQDQKLRLGDVHTVGPFPIESSNPGYGREFVSKKDSFDADATFKHQRRDYRWQRRGDLGEVAIGQLPALKDQPSVSLFHQSIQAPKPQKMKLILGTDDGHVVFLGEKKVAEKKGPGSLEPLANEYELDLTEGANDLYIKVVNHSDDSRITYAYRSPALDVPEQLTRLIASLKNRRSVEQSRSLREYYRKVYCLHPDWLALVDYGKGTRKAKEKLAQEIPTTLVWKELDSPRKAHVLNRGQYDQPGEEVPRATPSFLPPFPADAPENRLGLAKWLTQPGHPLTARVAVNRFWQQIFGTGLVKTSEDFGSQGEPPSHPQLLDWLAVDFQQSGWDVKRLLKALVMTDAYCRSARVTATMLKVDPNNRLLARGPRHRLDAEVLRDQALALAGMLVDQQGGPSVKPPQPDGLWAAVGYSGSNTVRFQADSGDKVLRRSVYVFWKRTSAPPQMSTLDAPSRESCTARRERTNTPLQALLLMNETQYLDASRNLAKRALEEPRNDGGVSPQQRIAWLFETVTARLPSEVEMAELMGLLNDTVAYYQQNPKLAADLVASSDSRHAAWTILASTLLNLDETVSK